MWNLNLIPEPIFSKMGFDSNLLSDILTRTSVEVLVENGIRISGMIIPGDNGVYISPIILYYGNELIDHKFMPSSVPSAVMVHTLKNNIRNVIEVKKYLDNPLSISAIVYTQSGQKEFRGFYKIPDIDFSFYTIDRFVDSFMDLNELDKGFQFKTDLYDQFLSFIKD